MNILFDLDGTLTDPKVGITKSIESALLKLDCTVPEDLGWCIGPPLHESFLELLGEKTKVDQAIEFYRERFSKVGMYENVLYEGIVECLKSLQKAEHIIILATSKPIIFASEILKHFGLSQYFYAEYGSELDGTRTDKTDLIKYIIEKENLNPACTYMIGDRKHDLIGARNNGLKYFGVSYGYGSLQEIQDEKPEAIFTKPLEIINYFKDHEVNAI